MNVIEETTVPDATVPGLSYRVALVPDDDTSPDGDGDWTTEADRAAWRNDEWQYVGVVVTPIYEGIALNTASTSLWAVVYGALPETEAIGVDSLATSPGHDLITEARELLVKELRSLTRLSAALSTESVNPS